MKAGGDVAGPGESCSPWHDDHGSPPVPLPYVLAVTAVVERRGLAGALCPQPSDPVARTDEWTCWPSRFLYRQEVGVSAKQVPRIIGRFPLPANSAAETEKPFGGVVVEIVLS